MPRPRVLSPLRLALWTTGIAGFALLGSVLLGRGIPLGWQLALFALHGTIGTLGVVFPAFGVWGDAACRGRAGYRRIALTFDDGPHPETTRRVLALLARHRKRATFFVLGCKVRKHPELAREIVEAGHGIGLHGDEHDRFYMLRSPKRVRADLDEAARALSDAAGVQAALFRPPVGFVSHGVALAAESRSLTLVGWSTRVLDGHRRARPEVLARALAGLTDGAVLLLHDAAEDDDRVPASLPVLGELLEAVERAGLEAVSVEELLADGR
jgi:peptidoglycan/xylan/chitin deacetylase (PgdA/CDA1 family)